MWVVYSHVYLSEVECKDEDSYMPVCVSVRAFLWICMYARGGEGEDDFMFQGICYFHERANIEKYDSEEKYLVTLLGVK